MEQSGSAVVSDSLLEISLVTSLLLDITDSVVEDMSVISSVVVDVVVEDGTVISSEVVDIVGEDRPQGSRVVEVAGWSCK